jgi:hypothetical protein
MLNCWRSYAKKSDAKSATSHHAHERNHVTFFLHQKEFNNESRTN